MIKIAIAIIFGLAVLSKLTKDGKTDYIKWNYGLPFMYGLATVEALCVVGLFTEYAHYSVYIMLAIMVGAIFTLLSKREPGKKYIMAFIASALLIAYMMMTHQ